ncbi:hypothetical protein ABZ614_45155 [Streptomyces sp. NPDC013178]|uniref:hypothetical protein n=1 Tax=Streptomyces sp. NPDC013178 TaxID=3155118 RepID=UPI0033DE7A29
MRRVLAAAAITITAVLVSAVAASANTGDLDKFSVIGLGDNRQDSQGFNGDNAGSHFPAAGNNAVANNIGASPVLSDILNNVAVPVIA